MPSKGAHVLKHMAEQATSLEIGLHQVPLVSSKFSTLMLNAETTVVHTAPGDRPFLYRHLVA